MAEERFPLPVSSYGELKTIIKTYGKFADKEARLDELARMAGINRTTISGNNGFLVAIGILDAAKDKKVLSNKGRSLALALEHEVETEIIKSWREVVSGNEFLQRVIGAVQIRSGMEPSTLQAHVAYSAGRLKTRPIMTGALAVIEILKASGMLKEADGKLISVPEDKILKVPAIGGDLTEGTDVIGAAQGVMGLPKIIARGEVGQSIPITIQIQVQCAPDEIENLGPKLRKLFNELSGPEKPEAGE